MDVERLGPWVRQLNDHFVVFLKELGNSGGNETCFPVQREDKKESKASAQDIEHFVIRVAGAVHRHGQFRVAGRRFEKRGNVTPNIRDRR
eukprot:s776_g11.t1